MLDTWREVQREWREHPPLEVHLEQYDALLDGAEEEESEQPNSQEAAA